MVIDDIEGMIEAAADLSVYTNTERTRRAYIEGARFMYKWMAANQDPQLYASILNFVK